MSRSRTRRALRVTLLAVSAGLATLSLGGGPALAAVTHQQITGSGSSWASNAVNQWVADVQSNGLQVVFTPNGSATGRRDFADQTSDFAVSDIGYQGVDPGSGASDTPCQDPNQPNTCLDFAYLPIVAGGTSFPYQIRVAGQLVRNLRLSGLTLAKIFTNQITNWDDPAITRDNNGRKLPNLAIIPVVHSEGSGSTAQFTRYLDTEFPSIWTPFNNGKNQFTEYFPNQGGQVAQNGSDGVINFVTSAAANGAIGYDEFSYALGKNYPVAQIENKAGYFTSPTQYNVAVALTKAQINYDKNSKDYLLQNLDQVYVNPDRRTYPLSSYSYGIIPTGPNSNDGRMNTAKRQTIADFLYYSICTGQAEMGPIGYSPLPVNLVQAGFQQIAKLHQADSGVNLTNENVKTCHNPTFVAGHPSQNYLAKIAPQPPACAKAGAGPCQPNQGVAIGNPKAGKPPTTTGTTGGSSGSHGQTTGGGSPTTPGGSVPGGSVTGSQVPGGSNPVVAGVPGSDTALVGTPTTLAAASNAGMGGALAGVAAVLLALVVAVPPILSTRLRSTVGRPGGPSQ
jgi:phosphate transport system substrate-binding protein